MLERIGEEVRGALEVRFKWIALRLVLPNPKHYNTSVNDPRLSGAPLRQHQAGCADCSACCTETVCVCPTCILNYCVLDILIL